jgi:hypothetical protein
MGRIAGALRGVVLLPREPGGRRPARAAAGVSLALVAALGFGLFVVGLDAASDGGATWAVVVAAPPRPRSRSAPCSLVSGPLRPPARLLPRDRAGGAVRHDRQPSSQFATTYGSAGHRPRSSAL